MGGVPLFRSAVSFSGRRSDATPDFSIGLIFRIGGRIDPRVLLKGGGVFFVGRYRFLVGGRCDPNFKLMAICISGVCIDPRWEEEAQGCPAGRIVFWSGNRCAPNFKPTSFAHRRPVFQKGGEHFLAGGYRGLVGRGVEGATP